MSSSLFAAPAALARDRSAPSAPPNLRITSTSAYQVSLAWDAASDNSGQLWYRLSLSDGRTFTIPQSLTSTSVNTGLTPGRSYAFCLYAVDASGNRSRATSCTSARLPFDVTAPSAPELTASYVGDDRVSLSWSPAIDDGSSVTYELLMDGLLVRSTGNKTSTQVDGLLPGSTHSFQVRALDCALNASVSNTLPITLLDSVGVDGTAPSTPTGLTALDGYCGDVLLYWTASVDDRDDGSAIGYEVRVDGVFDQVVVGERTANVTVDGAGQHTFEVIAIDSAGNASAPAVTSIEAGSCD